MKRIYLLLISAVCYLVISGFEIADGYRTHYSTGPDAGHSGDAASGFQTCANCHADFPVRNLSSVITSDIPSTGYIPGATYTIQVSVSEPDRMRYGFQISPQNSKGEFSGELVVTDEYTTQLNLVDERYINHTYTGVDFPDGTGRWSFQWIAPEAGSGEVIFYGAFLLSDKSLNPSGDIVGTGTLLVQESAITSLNRKSGNSKGISLKIFPNPASEILYYTIDLKEASDVVSSVVNKDGKVILNNEIKNLLPRKYHLRFPLNGLTGGLYYLHVEGNGLKVTKSFLVE